ncbi:MAG: ribosome maturation factor RimM [Actinomycetia bacterium]|nr:ribosome maturation factor RimM [Actinomycetes bacterium]
MGEKPGEDELLVVGMILRPHGVRGAVVVEAISDFPGRFLPGSRLLLETSATFRDVVVNSSSPHKGRLLVILEGVDDRDQAERLRGCHLWISARQVDTLGEGEYWIHELIGMNVLREDGSELGRVRDIALRDVQDILTVARPDGREFQVPFVGEFVRGVDTGNRTITVRLIEGMVPGD